MNKKTSNNKKNTRNKSLPSIFGTSMTREYLQKHPVGESMIEYLCRELIEYSNDPESIFIEDFVRKMRIPKTTFFNWTQKYPILKATFEEAKNNIGYNRMGGAIKRRFDRGAILHSQQRFGEEWREDDAYHDKRKQQTEEAANIKVILEKPEEVIDRNKHKPIKIERKDHEPI